MLGLWAGMAHPDPTLEAFFIPINPIRWCLSLVAGSCLCYCVDTIVTVPLVLLPVARSTIHYYERVDCQLGMYLTDPSPLNLTLLTSCYCRYRRCQDGSGFGAGYLDDAADVPGSPTLLYTLEGQRHDSTWKITKAYQWFPQTDGYEVRPNPRVRVSVNITGQIDRASSCFASALRLFVHPLLCFLCLHFHAPTLTTHIRRRLCTKASSPSHGCEEHGQTRKVRLFISA